MDQRELQSLLQLGVSWPVTHRVAPLFIIVLVGPLHLGNAGNVQRGAVAHWFDNTVRRSKAYDCGQTIYKSIKHIE